MKRLHIFGLVLAFALIPLFSLAQNLVSNPSFERVKRMPDDTSSLQNNIYDWFPGSKNGVLACHTGAMDANSNFGQPYPLRYQRPRTGQAMLIYKTLGYANGTYKFDNTRTYAASKLNRPIPRRAKVYAEFYINWHGYDCCRTEPRGFPGGQHGMLFTKDRPFENSYQIYPGQPQINIDTLLTDTVNWLKVSGTFISKEKYEYIVIGNFFDHTKCDYLLNNWSSIYAGGEAFII